MKKVTPFCNTWDIWGLLYIEESIILFILKLLGESKENNKAFYTEIEREGKESNKAFYTEILGEQRSLKSPSSEFI